jgi:hypothetical protein
VLEQLTWKCMCHVCEGDRIANLRRLVCSSFSDLVEAQRVNASILHKHFSLITIFLFLINL